MSFEAAKEAFNKNSAVTLQVGLLGAILAGAFYMGAELEKFRYSQEEVATALGTITAVLAELEDKAENDRWSYRMMKDFVMDLKERNPNIDIPNVSEIREFYILSLSET